MRSAVLSTICRSCPGTRARRLTHCVDQHDVAEALPGRFGPQDRQKRRNAGSGGHEPQRFGVAAPRTAPGNRPGCAPRAGARRRAAAPAAATAAPRAPRCRRTRAPGRRGGLTNENGRATRSPRARCARTARPRTSSRGASTRSENSASVQCRFSITRPSSHFAHWHRGYGSSCRSCSSPPSITIAPWRRLLPVSENSKV